MPRTTDRSSPSAVLLLLRASASSRWARRRVGVEQALGHPEVHRQGDEACLCSVVQVPLDPPQLRCGVVDGLGAGLGEHLDALLQHLGVTVAEEPAVHRAAGPHDRLDAEPPQRPGDDGQQQEHDDQRDVPARRWRSRAAIPGRARSSGHAPIRAAAAPVRPPGRAGRARAGACRGPGRPSPGAGRRATGTPVRPPGAARSPPPRSRAPRPAPRARRRSGTARTTSPARRRTP